MRERKYIKFRSNMYDDTKFKIIDMKPERDLIHYTWTRFVTLAGKVNLEGDLYMSKNIPYTIETLAIEFNRGIDQIKLALDVLIELEMIELTQGNIYRVKNFAKHQNIKVKEKIKSKDKEENINNKEVQVNENFKDEIHDNEDNQSENKISQNEVENIIIPEINNIEITHKNISTIADNSSDNNNNNSQGIIPILLETQKNKRENKNKKRGRPNITKKDLRLDITEEEFEDNRTGWFSDADEGKPLAEGECVAQAWTF